jgi:hypothetical protein
LTFIASFLAGSLLSLLLPALLLIALVVWSVMYTRAVPEPIDGADRETPDTMDPKGDPAETSHTPGEA